MAVDNESANILATLKTAMLARTNNLPNLNIDRSRSQSVHFMDIPIRRTGSGGNPDQGPGGIGELGLSGNVIEGINDQNRQVVGTIEGSTADAANEIFHMIITQRNLKVKVQTPRLPDKANGGLLNVNT